MSAVCSLHSWAAVDASWFSPWHLTSSNEIWNAGQRNVIRGNIWHMYMFKWVCTWRLLHRTSLWNWSRRVDGPQVTGEDYPYTHLHKELGGLGTQKIERLQNERPASSRDSERVDKTTNSEHLYHQNEKLWCVSCPSLCPKTYLKCVEVVDRRANAIFFLIACMYKLI